VVSIYAPAHDVEDQQVLVSGLAGADALDGLIFFFPQLAGDVAIDAQLDGRAAIEPDLDARESRE